jgi:fibronectin type III domain protein
MEYGKCTMAYDKCIRRASITGPGGTGTGSGTGGCTTPSRRADCEDPAGRYSGAVLVLAIASLLIACRGSSPGPTPSNSVTLEWDALSEPSLVGYRLYYGPAPGTYLQAPGEGLSVGNVPTYTLTGLSSGTTYYFGVTAYDTANNESDYSNEVFTTNP